MTPSIVAHFSASLQGLRICHINHRPVSKTGELGSQTVHVCASMHLYAACDAFSQERCTVQSLEVCIYLSIPYGRLFLYAEILYDMCVCVCACSLDGFVYSCCVCALRQRHVVNSVGRVNYDMYQHLP